MATDLVKIDAAGRSLELECQWVGTEDPGAPVLVFLHEGLGSVSLWRDFPARLCERVAARGLVYSRFGYGRSTRRPLEERFPVGFMHREAVEVLPALLDALDVRRPWLFGHSDGASIALLAAAAFPDRFQGVIVEAPHLFVEEVTVKSIEQARVAYRESRLRERLARHHDDADSAFYGWNDVWLDPAFREWNIEAEVAKIACPVLAIQGEDDEYGTLDQVRSLEKLVPQTQLLVLPKCGHSAHRDQPDAVIAGTAAFTTFGEGTMSWYVLKISAEEVARGDAGRCREAFDKAFSAALGPRTMALFQRECAGGGVELYLTPYSGRHAPELLCEFGCQPCERPSLVGLNLLVGHSEITYYMP